jgi:TonB family protein
MGDSPTNTGVPCGNKWLNAWETRTIASVRYGSATEPSRVGKPVRKIHPADQKAGFGRRSQSSIKTLWKEVYTINEAKVVAAFVLVTSSVVFSQASGPQATETRADAVAATRQPAQADPCAAKARELEQVEILSDTRGADFGPYFRTVVKAVRENWYSLMPPSVYPPTKKQGRVAIEFAIQSDGRIKSEKVEVSSGDVTLDQAAFAGISALRFDPLPKDYSGQQLYVRFHFYYNLAPDTSQLYISPCDVRVPAGSTMQFSVPMGGIERAAVTWSLSGAACLQAACGTISGTGLYTAPAKIPDSPTVFIVATPLSQRSFPVRTQLTVVSSPH